MRPSGFAMMQCQKSLRLPYRSFLGGSSDIFRSIFAQEGGLQNDYGLMLFQSPNIMQDAKPKIVDAPLTQNFRR